VFTTFGLGAIAVVGTVGAVLTAPVTVPLAVTSGVVAGAGATASVVAGWTLPGRALDVSDASAVTDGQRGGGISGGRCGYS